MREWSPCQPVYRWRLYGSCWYKLSLANVDCLPLIMHAPRWLSCWVNTEQNGKRKRENRGRLSRGFVLWRIRYFECEVDLFMLIKNTRYEVSSVLLRTMTSEVSCNQIKRWFMSQVSQESQLFPWKISFDQLVVSVCKGLAPSSGRGTKYNTHA